MKNLFFIAVLWLLMIPGCNQDATEDVVTPGDEKLLSESIYAPLFSYRLDPVVVADFRSRKGDAVERPIKFKAEGILYTVAESSECPDDYKMVIEGSGIGSHIGVFTNHLYYCFNVSGLTSYVTGKVVAANGDEFYVILIEAGEDWHYQKYLITGGNGRFTDATGTYTLYGFVDYEDGQWMHEGGGTIIY